MSYAQRKFDENMSSLPGQNSSSYIDTDVYQSFYPSNSFVHDSIGHQGQNSSSYINTDVYQSLYPSNSFGHNQSQNSSSYINTDVYQSLYPSNSFGHNSVHHQALSIPESTLHHPPQNNSTDFSHQIYHPNSDQNTSDLSSYGNTSFYSDTNNDVYQVWSAGESSLNQPLITPGSEVHHGSNYQESGPQFLPGSVSYHQTGYSPMNFEASIGHQQIMTSDSFGQYHAVNEPQPPLTVGVSVGQPEAINQQYQPMIVQASMENQQVAINQTFQEQQQHMHLHRGGEGVDHGTPQPGNKPRLNWTPELHAEFLSAISQLGGVSNATPKAILKKMNVRELTTEHIKSHLQRVRIYMKRSMLSAQTAGGKSFLVAVVLNSERDKDTNSLLE
nr:PREDICTED: transcription repressor KAN1-like [Daucus carota subsp. sativus]